MRRTPAYTVLMEVLTLDSLLQTVSSLADEKFDQILIRILTSDLPEPPDHLCRKCGPLLHEYVKSRLALHRCRRYWRDRHGWCTQSRDPNILLGAAVAAAKKAFHGEECECGLQAWRGQRWRLKNMPQSIPVIEAMKGMN